MAEVRLYDGEFIEALRKRCEGLSDFLVKAFQAVEDAEAYAKTKEDPWTLGSVRRIKEELSRASLETSMFCGVVQALKERIVKPGREP